MRTLFQRVQKELESRLAGSYETMESLALDWYNLLDGSYKRKMYCSVVEDAETVRFWIYVLWMLLLGLTICLG